MGLLSRLFRADASPQPRRDRQVVMSSSIAGGWANPVSGLGLASQDPSAQLSYVAGTVPPPSLVDSLYTHDWLADRVVEKMLSIALVRGFQTDEQTARDWQRLNFTERFPRGAFQTAAYDGRAYGGAVLLLGYKQGQPWQQLTPNNAKSGLAFLDVFKQHELRVLKRYDDPRSPDYGMPELYQVVSNCSGGQEHPRVGQVFHASRSIRFSGRPLRTQNVTIEIQDTTGTTSWPEVGVSVLTPVLKVLGDYGLAWSAVSNMLQDASIGWMKMAGLVEALSSEDADIVQARWKMDAQTRGTHRRIYLDADHGEEYGRTEVKFADIPQMLQMYIINVSGAAEVPARIFFGTSPQGLNANSSNEGDMKQLYDTCQAQRTDNLGPKLDTILTAMNGGKETHVTWPSLWESSDGEKAATRLATAQADKVYHDMYVVENTDIAKARRAGTHPELISKPTEERAEDQPGETGEQEGEGPQAAPDRKQASEIAKKQRAEEAK